MRPHPAFLFALPLTPRLSPSSTTPLPLPRVRRAHAVKANRHLAPYCKSYQSHYEVLDIPETADAATIKRAYRRAALKNHPDVSDAPDARERFLRVQEAYAVLSDSSRRASYDRKQRSPFSSASGGGAGFSGFDGFDSSEFAKQWRQNNPMPDDINDNLGSIFSDLFSGVADAVNSTKSSGVVEDFVEFLEKRVDGFSSGTASGSGKDGDALDDNDVLQSSDEDVLRAERDDAQFILDQLRTRRRKALEEEDSLRARARDWRTRADRADAARDYITRDTARNREDELRKEARRFSRRADETTDHVRRQESRLERIEQRLRELRDAPVKQSRRAERGADDSTGVGAGSNAAASQGSSSAKTKKQNIDDELEKMKREMGM